MSKIVYYAHSQCLYDTEQEKRDISLLMSLGLEVVNPNVDETKKGFSDWNKMYPNRENYMDYFTNIVKNCDALAFRSYIDGSIPSGVGEEIKAALSAGKPVIELPTLMSKRFLSIDDTILSLKYLGER